MIRVVKLGGSLFDLPGLGAALSAWIDRQRPARNLLVVGGGAAADALRDAHCRHGLPDPLMHRLCVDAMRMNAGWVQALVPGAGWCEDLEGWQREKEVGVWFLEPTRFIHTTDALNSAIPLPADWCVTSDSIAARAAALCQAEELVLLKSRLPDAHWNRREAAEAEYVDPYFPIASANVPQVRCVDFRHVDKWPEARLPE